MQQSEMPRNVVRFERLSYFTIMAGSIASMAVDWPAQARRLDHYPAAYLFVVLFGFAIQFWWIRLIARKRQNWARWVSVVMIGISLLTLIFGLIGYAAFAASPAIFALRCAIYLLWIVEFSFLFTGDAKGWFAPRSKIGTTDDALEGA